MITTDMKLYFRIQLLVFMLASIFACSSKEHTNEYTSLTPSEFSKKIRETDSVVIIDVRTPEEYVHGHISSAINIDWNESDFDKKLIQYDKSKLVFMYCLSGRRSTDAANHMLKMGFTQIYELKGGMLKWRSTGLPETNETSTGMSEQEFVALLISDKLVLVDFYAPWCAPCKQMEPSLNELSKEMKTDVLVVRINADENQSLFKSLKLETLPTLQLYKNKDLIWSHVGYLDKEKIVKQLKQ